MGLGTGWGRGEGREEGCNSRILASIQTEIPKNKSG